MKEGFYWVKPLDADRWTVGQRFDCTTIDDGHYWLIPGESEEYYDDCMEHIGARIKGQPDGSRR